MATHSSVLAWRIPGTGEPGGLASMGSHRVGHDWSDLAAAAIKVKLLYNAALVVSSALMYINIHITSKSPNSERWNGNENYDDENNKREEEKEKKVGGWRSGGREGGGREREGNGSGDDDRGKMVLGMVMVMVSVARKWWVCTSRVLTCCCCCQSLYCVQLCDPMDCRLPDSSVHGILQARTMEWVAVFFPRGSFHPGIEPTSPALAVQFFTTESPGKSRFLTYLSILKDNHGSWKEKLDLYIRYFFILLFSLVVTYSNQSLHHLLWERLIIPNLCMQGLVVGQLAKYVCPQRKGRGLLGKTVKLSLCWKVHSWKTYVLFTQINIY